MAEAELTTGTQATAQTATATEAAGDAADTSTILGGDAQAAAEDGQSATNKEGDNPSTEAKRDAPVIPEAYELTAPEGFTLDAAMLEAATPIFKEAGLTNEQAQKIMPAAAKFAESLKQAGEQQMLSHVMAERAAWAAEAKADKEIGGAKWDETVSFSAKALDALPENVGKPLRSLLNDSGLGNKREMIAAMSFFGRAIGEDATIKGEGNGASVPIAHKLYPNDVPKGG